MKNRIYQINLLIFQFYLKKQYEISSNNIDFVDENTIFEETTANIEINDEEIISNITKNKISIKSPLNTEGVLEKVKNNIYYALFYY